MEIQKADFKTDSEGEVTIHFLFDDRGHVVLKGASPATAKILLLQAQRTVKAWERIIEVQEFLTKERS